jgi:hypothetical protein
MFDEYEEHEFEEDDQEYEKLKERIKRDEEDEYYFNYDDEEYIGSNLDIFS